jgi:hypothetical protein
MTAASPLDPGLAAILESIRTSVGHGAAPADEPDSPAPVDRPAGIEPAAPGPSGAGPTLEQFVADLVRPQIEAWLNHNLPEIVQRLAAEEIRRLTGG